MTVETLQMLSLAAYIGALVLLVLAVVLFFLLDVPKLYGDVSGRTARKAIAAIRQQNEATGNKAYKPSAVNAERGKLTDQITGSGKIRPRTAGLPIGVGTEKLETATLIAQAGATEVLQPSAPETAVLYGETPSSGETEVLVQNRPSEPGQFVVEVEMSFAASSEIIE